MVTQYEVNMINPDGSTRIAFSGYETECLVASLLPGRCYAFQVRASNRIGVRSAKLTDACSFISRVHGGLFSACKVSRYVY